MNSIHPSAVVSTGAVLGEGNVVGPFAVIAAGVFLGDRNWIGSHVVIGAPPEIRDGEHPSDWPDRQAGRGVQIGSDNVIREGAQIHGGSAQRTRLGDRLFIMNQCYIAHDSVLEDDVTLASSVTIAGHVVVCRGANLGLSTAVHQRRRIGAFAMVGMSSVVTRDLPPFAVAFGSPARPRHVNSIGLQRAGFSDSDTAWAAEWIDGGALSTASVLAQAPAGLQEFLTARPNGTP